MKLQHALSLQPIIANVCSKPLPIQVPMDLLLKCACCWTAHNYYIVALCYVTEYGLSVPVHLHLNQQLHVYVSAIPLGAYVLIIICGILALPAPILHVVLVSLG